MAKKVARRYYEQAEEIRNRLGGRPYSIGLDLGVGSIGLAVAAFDRAATSPTDLVFATSRIFNPSTGAADRRVKRGQRNSLRHRANRLRFLWKLLAEENLMLPYSKKEVEDPARLRFRDEIIRTDPYVLRLRGLKEELTLHELGYAVYHIANHRGSSSVRTFLDDERDAEDKKLEEQERATSELAQSKGLNTFIEVLTEFNANGHIGFRNVNALKGKGVPVPTRDIITKELDTLLSTQQAFHPKTLTEEYCSRIRSAVLYENEKIVPEPGNCPYFPDEKKLPRSHFLNEERRLWEAINNARIEVPSEATSSSYIRYSRIPFSDEQRNTLFSIARSGKTLTVPLIRATFTTLKQSNIILQGKEKSVQKIVGFRFASLEEKPFWNHLTEEEQDAFFFAWTNVPDDEQLKTYLMEALHLSTAEADDALKTVKLIGDYGPIGKTATKLLMKYIEDGLTFTEAIEEALDRGELVDHSFIETQSSLPYYGKVLTGSTQALAGKYWHSAFKERREHSGFIKPKTNSDEEQYGKIANPVVHQTLNELRKLLNEIMEILGSKPEEIVVELAREIKVGVEERDRISREQGVLERNAARIYEKYCAPNNLSRKYIERFRLYEDQGFKCPYCLKAINVTDIAGNNVDIDHILPREDTGDSSYGNKVLAHMHCNREKGKRTPYAAFSASPLWGQIMHDLHDNPTMRLKRRKFEITDEQYAKYLERRGFASRFISDNSYIAKATLDYLRCLYDEGQQRVIAVRSLNGRETSILRRAWNLQGIAEQLGNKHIDKRDTSTTARKNRNDNRHHALDATVALYCTRSLIKFINTQSGNGFLAEEIERNLPIPNHQRYPNLTKEEYKESFHKEILTFMELSTFVSYKSDHALNGQLVKDTMYSVIGANPHGDELVFVVNKRVKDIQVKDGSPEEVRSAIQGRFTGNLPKWYSPSLKERIKTIQERNEAIIEHYEAMLTKAEGNLQETNGELIASGKKPLEISRKTISKRALEMTGGTYSLLSNNSRIKTFVAKEPTDTRTGSAFDTGSHFCLDFYHDTDGKLRGEIIRKVQAMNPNYQPSYKKEGYNLYVRLYQGDVCEVRAAGLTSTESESNTEKTTRVRLPNAKLGRTFIVINTFSETTSGFQIRYSNLAKSKREKDASFSLSSIQEIDVRKVQFSPAGLVQYISPLLKDKEE